MNRYMKPWANDPVFYLFQLSSFRIFYQKEQKYKNSIQKPISTFVTAHINIRHFMNSNYTFECWKCLQFQIFQLQVSVKVYAYCFNARKSIFEVRYCQPPHRNLCIIYRTPLTSSWPSHNLWFQLKIPNPWCIGSHLLLGSYLMICVCTSVYQGVNMLVFRKKKKKKNFGLVLMF